MLERGDMDALHEPLFDLYAGGKVELQGSTYTTIEKLLRELRARSSGPNLFVKETTDHRYDPVLADRRFLVEAHHAFLIRRPEEIVASYHALYPEMQRHDVGLEALHELYCAVADAGGHRPVVIDSDDLMASPAAVMAAYCEAVGLPFLPHALTWSPDDRPEWQRTARWHRTAAASSGFEPRSRVYEHTVHNSDRLAAFARHHRPFYDALHTARLRVDTGAK